MKTIDPLIKLERICRNMPLATPLTMIQRDTKYGTIYIGLGRGADGTIHSCYGMWVGEQFMSHMIEFTPDSTEDGAIETLSRGAFAWAETFDQNHMNEQGWWTHGRA